MGLDTLVALFTAPRQAARPVDLFASQTPQIWLSQQEQGGTLGLFNWDDAPARVEIPRGIDAPMKGRDVWTGEPVDLQRGVDLPAHGSLLARW